MNSQALYNSTHSNLTSLEFPPELRESVLLLLLSNNSFFYTVLSVIPKKQNKKFLKVSSFYLGLIQKSLNINALKGFPSLFLNIKNVSMCMRACLPKFIYVHQVHANAGT